MENLPLIFKRYTSENEGKELLGAVELRLELPGETDVRLGITAITFLVDWGDGESDHSAAHHYEQAGYYRVRVVGTAISQLDVSKCHLTELKLDKCPLLENLNCAYNRLITLELVCCPKLKLLNCSGNRLSVLRSRCNRGLVRQCFAKSGVGCLSGSAVLILFFESAAFLVPGWVRRPGLCRYRW